jgi:hypothetical protein
LTVKILLDGKTTPQNPTLLLLDPSSYSIFRVYHRRC